MPKMKTNSAAKKRLKKLKSGKIKRARTKRRHLLTKKSKKTKRHLRQSAYINSSDMNNVAPLLPY